MYNLVFGLISTILLVLFALPIVLISTLINLVIFTLSIVVKPFHAILYSLYMLSLEIFDNFDGVGSKKGDRRKELPDKAPKSIEGRILAAKYRKEIYSTEIKPKDNGFENADLDNLILPFKNLEGENLENANLSFSDLRNANLRNANLCGAILCDTDLEYAEVIGANFQGAYYSERTKLPFDTETAKVKGMVKVAV
ncbi:MAG: pentapeptide repeat-containing protein [Bdellovibrionales bacterium]|nr:pentapeptide repeat-containing protein [Bdellovibrionales bacterium]